MTEIEKMFENVGVEPIDSKLEPMGTLKFSVDDIGNTWTREQYMKEVPIYPPFTAEKQLELIKWLGENKNGFGFFNEGTESLSCQCDFHWEWFDETFYAKDFDNALAGLINELWQDLTDQEKEEIRRILNE